MDEGSIEATRTVRKIDREDADYKLKEMRHEWRQNNKPIFGVKTFRELNIIDLAPLSLIKMRYQSDSKDEAKTKVLNQARDHLRNLYSNSRTKAFVESFLTENDFQPSLDRIEDPFINSLITDERLVIMLNNHIDLFKLKELAFQEGLPSMQSRFEERLEEALKEGRNLFEVPLRRYREWKNRPEQAIHYRLGDGLAENFQDSGGEYREKTKEVVILAQTSDAIREDVFTHEMFHALSGTTHIYFDDPYDGNNPNSFVQQREGLGFYGYRFRWLNEAVTELLTRSLLERHGAYLHPAYQPEQDLVNKLLARMPKDIQSDSVYSLVQAYFEDLDPRDKVGERVSEWRNFYDDINQYWESGFLLTLDKAIIKGGIKAGHNLVKQKTETTQG